ncbi:glycosyltransferase [Cronobacter universalis]|uniref:glycosyltransferase n=1 Tax=Cronobacter universalis TaxID=535744 RepID=UPI0024AFF48D|nr:glycosyltransferase [Cronobacter universalis]MDI7661038.1 glycosyltransferase [Cronobacter universalis]
MASEQRKILLLDNGKEWGGGTNSMLELLKRIDRQRFDITCCFYYNYSRGEGQTIESVLNSIGIPVIFHPPKKQPLWAKVAKEMGRACLFFSRAGRKAVTRQIDYFWRIKPDALALRNMLKSGGYDILYMNNQPGSNIEGYVAAAPLPVSVVQHCRIEPVMTPDIARRVNETASAVIAVSHGVEKVLVANGVNASLCHTVTNAIDVNQPLPERQAMRNALGIDDETFLFGSIGSLIPRKSHHHTLEALSRFHLAHPEAKWKVMLTGDGPERGKLAELAQRYGLQDKVVFTGFRNNPLDYLAAFDTFILASSSEGLPRVVLESMLLGTVVIGSAVTGTAELINHEQTGLLFPYGDVALLASLMERVWQDAALRQRLKSEAALHVRAHYSIEHYVAGVEAILSNVQPIRNFDV